MDDIAELISDLDRIISIQTAMIKKLSDSLLQYVELEELESMCAGRDEVEALKDKWKE